jgi:hypothetical protein
MLNKEYTIGPYRAALVKAVNVAGGNTGGFVGYHGHRSYSSSHVYCHIRLLPDAEYNGIYFGNDKNDVISLDAYFKSFKSDFENFFEGMAPGTRLIVSGKLCKRETSTDANMPYLLSYFDISEVCIDNSGETGDPCIAVIKSSNMKELKALAKEKVAKNATNK